MRLIRFPRLLSAALAGVAVGAAVATGWNLTSAPTGSTAGDAPPTPAEALAARANGGSDRSDRAADDPDSDIGQAANGGEAATIPPPDFDLLEQPKKPYPTPDLPEPPDEEEPELTRIKYELEKLTWIAAGVVEKDPETSCTVDEDRLSEEGDYEFSCTVKVSDQPVTFDINAAVSDTEVQWEWTASRFAVTEEKVQYEAIRQSYKPGRVTCNFEGVQLVRIGAVDAIRCWVTRPDGDQMTYYGELLRDGSLVFRPGEAEDAETTDGESPNGGTGDNETEGKSEGGESADGGSDDGKPS